ncbi:MAG: hypothetical protein RLY56_1452, partial [Pseudomonadota bacterium]
MTLRNRRWIRLGTTPVAAAVIVALTATSTPSYSQGLEEIVVTA